MDKRKIAVVNAVQASNDAARLIAHLEAAGYALVPIKLTPAIACALEMCGPPEAQKPEALEQLVKDYEAEWSHVIAAACQ